MYVSLMHTTPTAQTGEKVRAAVRSKGMTQAEIATAIDLSQSQLSKRLRGAIPFDINELTAIADALDVPLTDLLPQVGAVA